MKRVTALALMICLATSFSARAEDDKVPATVVDAAVAGKFTKLVAAVKAAELVDTLKGEGPFTVFAPTDKAFEALGEDTLNAVLKDKEKLQGILKYHVIKGAVPSKDAIELAKGEKSAKTVQGGEIKFSLNGDKLMLNGKATVIKADVKVGNGVIHVIDAVIMPPA
jgi:uncharacterized surface protein with fasciclin (FAS1) repeats